MSYHFKGRANIVGARTPPISEYLFVDDNHIRIFYIGRGKDMCLWLDINGAVRKKSPDYNALWEITDKIKTLFLLRFS